MVEQQRDLMQQPGSFPLKEIGNGMFIEGVGHIDLSKFSGWCRHNPLVIEPLNSPPDFQTPRREAYKDFLSHATSHIKAEPIDYKNFSVHLVISQIPREKIDFCPTHGLVETQFSSLLVFPNFTLLGVGFTTFDAEGFLSPSRKGRGSFGFAVSGWITTDRDPQTGDIYQVIIPDEYGDTPRIDIVDRILDPGDIFDLQHTIYDQPIDKSGNFVRDVALAYFKDGR